MSPNVPNAPDKPSKEPTTEAGKRLMEQAHDALDNVREGYKDVPDVATADVPEHSRKPATGGTEPTHIPSTDRDRR